MTSIDKLGQLVLRLASRAVLRKLRRGLARQIRSEDGSNSVEAMLMLPLMIWVFLGSYVFFDAYRAQFLNAKASYTIGDILSRETDYVTPEYLDSLYDLQRFLILREDPVRLRVSVVEYDEDTDTHTVIWSQNRGGGGVLDGSNIDAIVDRIPIMSDGEKVAVVQTSMEYVPIYAAGIDTLQFDDFVVTRPRFAGQLCWNTVSANPTITTAIC